MMVSTERGMTLIELLMALALFALIATGAVSLLSSTLGAHTQENDRSDIYREGMMIMERLTGGVRSSTFLFVPNAHSPTRDILAFSGSINEDGDNYFGDPLFPRIDEDPKKQMTDDDLAGIQNIDDDGDALIDEGDKNDDDEDGLVDEDPLDGFDNDGDGNVDEDTGDDANVAGMDDDGDGSVDEGDPKDDDEDGTVNEDEATVTVYSISSGTSNLQALTPYNGQTDVLSTRVRTFQVTWEAPQRIFITLVLDDSNGNSVTFSEYVHLENAFQTLGKRVR